MAAIVDFWRARTGRERALLGTLAAILSVALWFFALVNPLMRGAEALERKLAAEQALLERVEALSSRMERLPPPRPRSDASLLLAANRALQEAGLSAYLEEGSADGQRRVRLRLKDAPFPQVGAWLADMAAQEGARTVSADVEPTGSPGRVRISLVLERSD